jgi:two-component sensor histidine kinase
LLENQILLPDIRIKNYKISMYLYPYAIAAGIIPSIVIENQSTKGLDYFLLWGFLKLVGFTALYLFWLSIKRLLAKIGTERLSLPQIALVGALGGVIQVVVILLGIPLIGLTSDVSSLKRILGSLIAATFWLPIQSVAGRNFSRYRRQRLSLLKSLGEFAEMRLAQSGFLANLRRTLQSEIQLQLHTTSAIAKKAFDEATVANEGDISNIPAIIREIASGPFRQLSHSLARTNATNSDSKSFRSNFYLFREALWESVHTRPLNPYWFSGFLLVLSGAQALKNPSIGFFIWVTVTLFILTFGIQWAGLWAFARIRDFKIELLLLVTGANIFIPILFVFLMKPFESEWFGYTSFPRNLWLFPIAVTTMTIVGYIAQAGILNREQMQAYLRKRIDIERDFADEINFEILKTSRLWGKHIHGRVQSRLNASALMLEQAQERGDIVAITAALSQVRNVLETPGQGFVGAHRVLEKEIEYRVSLWSSLVKISVEIAPEVFNFEMLSVQTVGDLIEEAFSNSVRHGGASNVKLFLANESDKNLFIKVVDDGQGALKKNPGFGIRLYDSETSGNWTLLRNARRNETILELRIRVSD